MAQENPHCLDPEFDAKVEKYVRRTVPLMDVKSLADSRTKYLILDAREPAEYGVSHISGAFNIGFDKPDFDMLNDIPTDTEIVVYCSIGYRSEKIGERLQDMGYTNVSNLFGGIFEWSNRDYILVDKDGQPANELHTYSRAWSKWVDTRNIKRIW